MRRWGTGVSVLISFEGLPPRLTQSPKQDKFLKA